ncbi:MAG: ABC transporter substrate-binding protein, partial [Tepidisphaeraceae bacterium]
AADKLGAESAGEVKLGYFANVTHAQAVLGVASGDFERAIAPATLTTRLFNAGPSLIEAMFAGEVDIAYVGPGPALAAFQKSKGQGIRVIAGAAGDGVVIVARKGLGIASFDQLKGRKLATPQHGNTQDISARHFLQQKFGSDAITNIVPISNAEQVGMMRRGDIDAAWVPEPWGQMLISQADATLVAEEKDLWPDKRFSLTVVITTPAFLKAHPDVVQRMLAVHHDWTLKLQNGRQAYLQALEDALFKLQGKRLPEGVLATALDRVRFIDAPDAGSFEAFAAWSNALGFARSSVSLTDLIDTTILDSVITAPSTQTTPATQP